MMKRLTFLGLVVLLAGPYVGCAQEVRHVVIISIDGFRPDFYREHSWGAVNLRQMARDGVSADGVNSIFPSLTFPNHTSIITGVRSARHGIFHNSPFSESGGSAEWYWYEKAITARTLWDAVKDRGGVTASVNWPVSVGAPIDYNIPIVKRRGFTQLEITAQASTPDGLMEEVQKYATGQLDSVSFNTNEDLLIMDQNVSRIAGYLIRKYKPVLTTVRLSCVDHFEHLEGREGDGVTRAVAGADHAIGHIRESVQRAGIKDNTLIVVTGDHGFVNVHTSFSPNYILKKAGLMNDVEKNDWQAQFKAAGGSSFLYLKNPDDTVVLNKVKALVSSLSEFRENKFRFIDRKQLDRSGVDPHAALALTGQPGYSFTGTEKGPFMKAVRRGTHGYFPDFKEIQTGFVASGPGLKKGMVIPVMEIIDVTALVTAVLRLDMHGMEGEAPSRMLNKN